MQKQVRATVLLLIMALLLSGCGKQSPQTQPEEKYIPQDTVEVIVNGEEVMQSVYLQYREQYISRMYGVLQSGDPSTEAYVEDLARTACIRDVLLQQDIRAQGCDVIPEADAQWLKQAAADAFDNALNELGEYLREILEESPDADMRPAAEKYAEEHSVSVQTYYEIYLEQYIAAQYYNKLMENRPVTDEDIAAAYNARVENSRKLYENDVSAFETAIASGAEVWYRPAGYRSILQILLPASGSSDEEKLASVQSIVDDIYARLDAGESFESLIAEYGADGNFADPQFVKTGYSVHRSSILWEPLFIEASFSEELSQPGTWLKTPVVSDSAVHILYYLADTPGGALELTQQIKDALTQPVYEELLEEALNARLDELSDAAEVIFPEK